MAVPAIKLVAWSARHPDWCFVAVPNERGRYLRTDLSTVYVGCPYPGCLSIPGEPCKSHNGYTAGTHSVRRAAYQAARRANREPGLGALRDVPK